MAPFRYPRIPHLRGSLWVQGDVVLGPRASREFFRRHRCLAVTEKLDGYNVAILFERPWALRVFHRGLDLHELYAAWVPPALVWVEAELGRLYRMLREDWVLCGEWVDKRSSLKYPGSSSFFVFDLYHRPTRRFVDGPTRRELCAAYGLETTPDLHRGPIDALEEALELLQRSRWGAGPAEGLVFYAEEGGLVRKRAKYVRPDFVRRPAPQFRLWAGP